MTTALESPTRGAPRRVRVCLTQLRVLPGQPAANTAALLAAAAAARARGAEMMVCPELAIPGYLLGDAWERDAFLRECEACGEEVRAASQGITILFGNVGLDWTRRNEDGRVRKYNALFAARDGRFHGPRHSPYPFAVKTLLPNYREFDDARHFYDLRRLALEEGRPAETLLAPIDVGGLALGGILCEDAWDADYGLSPLAVLGRQAPDLIVNASCSPFTRDKHLKRHRVFAEQARRLRVPILFVNAVGIQNNGKTVFTFDGGSCAYDPAGGVLDLPTRFEPGMLDLDLPLDGRPWGRPADLRPDGPADLCQALLTGIREFLDLTGLRRVVVGISGGIDSAVAAALYRRVLAPDDLLLASLPGPFTSSTTRGLARQLAGNLGCLFAEVPIVESVALTARQLDGLTAASADGARHETLRLDGARLENVQARDRSARLLAALASAFGGGFTCNANKAEATVGYTTLYGDLGGFLAALGDLWKGDVYALGRHLNGTVYGREVIPEAVFALTPSAELSPDQAVDRGLGDPLIYPYHDRLFASWVESWRRTTPEDILAWYLAGTLERQIGYAGRVADLFPGPRAFLDDLEHWWTQYNGLAVAKRIQAPPVLAVTRRAFGFDHREAQLRPWFSRRYADLKRQALAAAAG